MNKFILILFLCIPITIAADNRVRIWERIPRFFVDQRVTNFINGNGITNCFEYVEKPNYLRLKCWKNNKLIDVDININSGKPKKRHYVQDILSIVI